MDTTSLPEFVRYQDLATHGISRYRFDQMVANGAYERIAPGLFLRSGTTDDTTAVWMAIAVKRPEATLCLSSALSLHDLTDEIPSASDIALPRGTQPPVTRIAPIRWHQFDRTTFAIGATDLDLPCGITIHAYSAERTIIDLFRLTHIYGRDLAIDALKRWLPRRRSSAAELLIMAKHFPKAAPTLRQSLEVLL